MKMNVPNSLTMLRMLLIPVFVSAFLYVDDVLIASLVACGVFILASITDFLDGKIARRYGLVTNFGKIMDPLADKVLVFAAFVLLSVRFSEANKILSSVMIWATIIVILRELGITSVRAVCAGSGTVIAANLFGKLKTVTQMLCIIVSFVEFGLIQSGVFTLTAYIPTYITIGLMVIMTVGSGINYIKQYLPELKA